MSAEGVHSEHPRDFDPVNFTVVPPRGFEPTGVPQIQR